MANINEIKLSPEDILKKQFGKKINGYDKDEVDAYLDKIIADYSTFSTIINELSKQIASLKKQLDQQQASDSIKQAVPSYSETPDIADIASPNGEISTNMAIVQRISTLERKVYNLEQKVNRQERTYTVN